MKARVWITVSNLYSSYIQGEELVYVHATYCHAPGNQSGNQFRVGSGGRALIFFCVWEGMQKWASHIHAVYVGVSTDGRDGPVVSHSKNDSRERRQCPVLHNICVLLHPSCTCTRITSLWSHLWQIIAAIPTASSSSLRCQVWSRWAVSDAVLEQMTGKDVGRAMGRIAQCPTGGDTTPAVPHSLHKMTLDTSPELKECARRPLPDRYDHIYIQTGK